MAAILGEEEKSHPIESEKDADEDMGFNKLMYDRDIPGYNPRDLEYCKPLADLAIDFYNQQLIGSKQYTVVDLIRVIGVLCSSYYFSMKFTATVVDFDADVITFGEEVYDGIE